MNASRQHGTVLGIQTTESNTPLEYLYHDAVTRVTHPSRHHRGIHRVAVCCRGCGAHCSTYCTNVAAFAQYNRHTQHTCHTQSHLPHAVTPATRSHTCHTQSHLPHAATKTCINHTAKRQQNKTPCRYISTYPLTLPRSLALSSQSGPRIGGA